MPDRLGNHALKTRADEQRQRQRDHQDGKHRKKYPRESRMNLGRVRFDIDDAFAPARESHLAIDDEAVIL